MQSFFEFLVSAINHYHINGLHVFWISFEWFCLQINTDTKYCSFLIKDIVIEVIYKALCFDVAQGRMNGAPNETRLWLRLNSCYSILFSNLKQKEHNIIICSGFSCHMDPMYIESHIYMSVYTYLYILLQIHK